MISTKISRMDCASGYVFAAGIITHDVESSSACTGYSSADDTGGAVAEATVGVSPHMLLLLVLLQSLLSTAFTSTAPTTDAATACFSARCRAFPGTPPSAAIRSACQTPWPPEYCTSVMGPLLSNVGTQLAFYSHRLLLGTKPASVANLLPGMYLKKNLNASRPSEHPPVRVENVKTFMWDHRLQILVNSNIPGRNPPLCILQYLIK